MLSSYSLHVRSCDHLRLISMTMLISTYRILVNDNLCAVHNSHSKETWEAQMYSNTRDNAYPEGKHAYYLYNKTLL